MAVATQIILDPTAHHHRMGRVWQGCQRDLLRRLAPVEVTLARNAEEAREVVRLSALKGFGKMICVGGSSTAHGVVNGLMGLAESHRRSIGLGFLSIIRQEDWSRTLGLPREMERQVEILSAGHTLPFDVGRVDYFTVAGEPATRHFLNGAGFGFATRLRHEIASRGGRTGGAWLGVARAFGDLLANQGPPVRLEGDHGVLYSGPCPLGLVMGGRFYAALGEIAPEASPTDGALDAVWMPSTSTWKMLAQLAGLAARRRKGSSVPARARARTIHASSLDGPVYLEADGEPLGRLPATFAIEPRALQIIVPEVGARLKKAAFAPLPELKGGNLAGNLKSPAVFAERPAPKPAARMGGGGAYPAS